jgi:hypothetical protein
VAEREVRRVLKPLTACRPTGAAMTPPAVVLVNIPPRLLSAKDYTQAPSFSCTY